MVPTVNHTCPRSGTRFSLASLTSTLAESGVAQGVDLHGLKSLTPHIEFLEPRKTFATPSIPLYPFIYYSQPPSLPCFPSSSVTFPLLASFPPLLLLWFSYHSTHTRAHARVYTHTHTHTHTLTSNLHIGMSACGRCNSTTRTDSGCCDGAALLLCGRCKTISYCSKQCQCLHWKVHKTTCLTPKEQKLSRAVAVRIHARTHTHT